MRTSNIVVGLATAVVIAAQSASELAAAIPACAKPALDEAATRVGCDTTDYACICGPKKDELVVYASPKVVDACGTEAAVVLETTNALCDFVLANPRAAGGDSSSTASEATTRSKGGTFVFETSSTASEATTRSEGGTFVFETSSTVANATPTTTEQAQDTSMSTLRPPGVESGEGLSTGAKAGIAAGVVVVAVLGLLILFLLWRRHKRSKQSAPLHVIDHNDGESHEKAELVGTEIGAGKLGSHFSLFRKAELPENSSSTGGIAEMGGSGGTDSRRSELQSKGGPQEHTSEFLRPTGNISMPPPAGSDGDQATGGPVPLASDLYRAPQSSIAIADDQAYFERQERRLKERRMLIEKQLAEEQELIDMEERALQRKKAIKNG